MARTLLPDQQPTTGGLEPAYTAAGVDGHAFNCNRGTVLEVETGGTAVNLTFATPGTVDSGAIPDKVVAIPANKRRRFGFKDQLALYRQLDGTVWLDVSPQTNVTLAVVQTS